MLDVPLPYPFRKVHLKTLLQRSASLVMQNVICYSILQLWVSVDRC